LACGSPPSAKFAGAGKPSGIGSSPSGWAKLEGWYPPPFGSAATGLGW